jgi:hypothetical protein
MPDRATAALKVRNEMPMAKGSLGRQLRTRGSAGADGISTGAMRDAAR